MMVNSSQCVPILLSDVYYALTKSDVLTSDRPLVHDALLVEYRCQSQKTEHSDVQVAIVRVQWTCVSVGPSLPLPTIFNDAIAALYDLYLLSMFITIRLS